jgi:glycine/D-amino acid oxidase-like deaminating enzyme
MEARAALLVASPCDNPTRSYWQEPPDAIADFRSPRFPGTADVVVIGSGITGAGVVWNLLRHEPHHSPPLAVVMLEARQACSGATGRNGGHTKAASYRSFQGHAKTLGVEAACQIARLELANIRAVHAFAAEHNIECESRPCETVDVVYDSVQWSLAHEAVDAMRAAMPDDDASRYRFVTPAQLQEEYHVDSQGPCGGVIYEAGSISAYKFTIGVLKLCLAKGLNLQTNTPALAVSKNPQAQNGYDWLVETSSGTIRTKKVVLATNGYTAYINTRFQGIIVPTRGQVTAQRPGSNMPPEGLPATYSFIYEDGFDYMIPKPPNTHHAGDIVIGGGLVMAPHEGREEYGSTDDASLHPFISDYLLDTTPRYFGSGWGQDHVDGRVRREWTGIMGFSFDGLPFVGPMPGEEGVWVAAGFQGHGMVYCWMCAQALADMVMRQGHSEGAPPWFPDSFLITQARLGRKFEGVTHTATGDAE